MTTLTPEQQAARVGKITASRVREILPGKSGKPLASRAGYRMEKAIELVTGQPCEQFQGNYWTDRGSELECHAIAAYEARTGAFVEPSVIVPHPTLDYLQSTPDGFIGSKGLIEAKCPKLQNHWSYFETGVPAKYFTQIQLQLLCAQRQWCDFVSYHPDMPGNAKLYIERVLSDEEHQALIETEAQSLWVEVLEMVEKIREVAA